MHVGDLRIDAVLDGTGRFSPTKSFRGTTEEQWAVHRDLLDEDGQFLVSQGVTFDKVEVQYFVPTRSGLHRLWLRGAPGTRHFRFGLHVPPVIGG